MAGLLPRLRSKSVCRKLSKAWESSLTLLQPIKNLHVGPQGLKEYFRSPWNHLLSFLHSEKSLPASSPSCLYLYHMPSSRYNFSSLPLSHASFKERMFFLQPLASNESFGFRPGMFITEIRGLWRESLQYHGGRRETNWTLQNIYLDKWLGKMNSMESSTMPLISPSITVVQGRWGEITF